MNFLSGRHGIIKILTLCIAFLTVYTSIFSTGLSIESNITAQNVQSRKQAVSPNPEVYLEFYGKNAGRYKNNEKVTSYAAKKYGEGRKLSPSKQNVSASSKTEKVLVIPIQFTDTKFSSTHNQAYFDGIIDKLRDYYEENSSYAVGVRGMTISYTVAPVVTSSRTMSYYGADKLYLGDDEKNGPVYEMAREAVKLADPSIDFSQFDNDKDGVVDHLVIIHSGDGQENSSNAENIWSNQWVIGAYGTYNNNSALNDDYLDGERIDGVYAYNYACVAESSTLGAYAHEFGHDLGLPDLYDTDGPEGGESAGVGDWDVMGSGSWNCMPGDEPGTCPANLSAWSKEVLGWVTPVDIVADGKYTLENTSSNNQVFRIWTDVRTEHDEYYLIEYRRKNGYDAGLPGEGLLVWHIDVQQIIDKIGDNAINAYRGELGVSLEQADGKDDLYQCVNQGDSGDPFPGSTGNKCFCAIPYGFNYDNQDLYRSSYVDILNINAAGNNVTADYYITKKGVSNPPVLLAPADNNLIDGQPIFSWNVVPQAGHYKFQISTDKNFTTDLFEIVPSGFVYRGNTITYTLPSERRLADAKTYYWRVTALNDLNYGGTILWSEVRSFKTPDHWQRKADIPTARAGFAAAECNGKIYTFGGYIAGSSSDTVEEYDPVTDKWTQKGKMPTPRQVQIALSLNGKIYLLGGGTPSVSYNSLFEEYDPINDKWSAKASFPYQGVWFTATVANGKIYAISIDGSTSNEYIQEYDPGQDKWNLKSTSKNSEFGEIFSATIDNKIYIIQYGQHIKMYDPLENTLIEKQAMFPEAGNSYSAVTFKGKIYFLYGGYNYWYYEMYEYDIDHDTFNRICTMPTEMSDMAVAATCDKIYAISGQNYTEGFIKTVEEFTPSLQRPGNIKSTVKDTEVSLTWDQVPGADGYYILADGTEIYSITNSFTQNSLTVNSKHSYQIRAVNAKLTGEWSDNITAVTSGGPVLTAETANLTEGNEDGALITVHLTSGEFEENGIYNKSTVTLDPYELPAGVKQGDVVRKDANTVEIKLIGNSTSDYNGDKMVTVFIDKGNITTGGYADPSAEILFKDKELNSLSISLSVSLSDTFAEGHENGEQILITVNNGQFINKIDQTKLQINGLPNGVSKNTVTRTGDNIVTITLAGNSTADYDTDIPVTVKIEGDQIVPTQLVSLCGIVKLLATCEPQPSAPIITFSFDSWNAGKLVGITTDMEYSFDGGNSFKAAIAANQQLSSSEIESITSGNGIIIRKSATLRDPFGLPAFIGISPGPNAPNITGNDETNMVSGMSNWMEFSTDGSTWTKYSGSLPDLSGNVTFRARYAAVYLTMAGAIKTITFTATVTPPTPTPTPAPEPTPPPTPTPAPAPTPTLTPQPLVTTIIGTVSVTATVPQTVSSSGVVFSAQNLNEQANNTTGNSAIVSIPKNAAENSAAIGSEVFSQLIEKGNALTVKNSKISITLPPAAIAQSDISNAGDKAWVKISMEQADKAAIDQTILNASNDNSKGLVSIGDNLFEISSEIVTKDKTQRITSFQTDVSITISLDGTNLKGIDTDKLGVYYYNEISKQWEYMGGNYKKDTNTITFSTSHFSVYSVMKYEKTFKDIKNHWARSDIEKMAAKHIAEGSGDLFNPDGKITRAEFIALLVRALGLKAENCDMPFTDVKNTKWYYKEIGTAYKAGIAVKEGGALFRPDAYITRQEMAIFTANAIKIRLNTEDLSDEQAKQILSGFKDKGKISKTALKSAALVVQKRIVQGRSGPTFAPNATAARAEAIVMLKRLIQLF